jgi:hypothetical protein
MRSISSPCKTAYPQISQMTQNRARGVRRYAVPAYSVASWVGRSLNPAHPNLPVFIP